jgi:hypothetical protein
MSDVPSVVRDPPFAATERCSSSRCSCRSSVPLNLAAVRGTDAIQRASELTGVDDLLVLVDDPEDLMPPPLTP